MSINPCIPEEKESCQMKVIALNDFIDILGGKWRFPIIFSLYFESLRFSELKRQLVPVTSRALTQNLEDLMINQLITKNESTNRFSLTEYAADLKDIVNVVREYHNMKCHEDGVDLAAIQESLNDAMKSVFRDLAGKWRMVIMGTLFYGDVSRFSELHAVIPRISSKELSRNLVSLIESGIIEHQQNESDARGSYALSEQGKRFEGIIQEMVNWSQNHREFLKEL